MHTSVLQVGLYHHAQGFELFKLIHLFFLQPFITSSIPLTFSILLKYSLHKALMQPVTFRHFLALPPLSLFQVSILSCASDSDMILS